MNYILQTGFSKISQILDAPNATQPLSLEYIGGKA